MLVRGGSKALYWFTLKHRLCVLLDPYRGPKRVRVNAVCKRLFLGQVVLAQLNVTVDDCFHVRRVFSNRQLQS